jgi:hypothetical protein
VIRSNRFDGEVLARADAVGFNISLVLVVVLSVDLLPALGIDVSENMWRTW